MEFPLFKEHTRNPIGINIIGFVIPGTAVDKKQTMQPVLCPM